MTRPELHDNDAPHAVMWSIFGGVGWTISDGRWGTDQSMTLDEKEAILRSLGVKTFTRLDVSAPFIKPWKPVEHQRIMIGVDYASALTPHLKGDVVVALRYTNGKIVDIVRLNKLAQDTLAMDVQAIFDCDNQQRVVTLPMV